MVCLFESVFKAMANRRESATLTTTDGIILQDFMVKRSQQKKLLSPTNYRNRWFVLTKKTLNYYEGTAEKRGKLKGTIPVSSICIIESVSEQALNKKYVFQVGYDDFVLYIVCNSAKQRQDWIKVLRELCQENERLLDKYHPGISNGQYTCCDQLKAATGCESTWIFKITSKTKGGTNKYVIALYSFEAAEEGDLHLVEGMEYEVLDDSKPHWWRVKNKYGEIGFVPSNYVEETSSAGIHRFDWHVGDVTRQRCESLLKCDGKEGSFVVRNSSTNGLYTLSLFTKYPRAEVKHYRIKKNDKDEYYLTEKHSFPTVHELIRYHQHNGGGLVTRLKKPPVGARSVPTTAGLSHDKWEIDPLELTLLEELGSGQFGVVRRGKWRATRDVAVKIMKAGTMSEDDFIEEAQVMTKLQHPNLVQLYGVCSNRRPIFIVTEFMKHGSLLNYLRANEARLAPKAGILLDMAMQVCSGMAYLEEHNYIHRDLAARNCLVGAENVVKVADFGLARYVLDDEYTSSGGTKFPIKWAPPEVLGYTRFSSKSDVWAYGVLVWEIFTCGKMPYGRATNAEVVEQVQRGQRLDRPRSCPREVYTLMRACWERNPESRPSFRQLKRDLEDLLEDHEAYFS